MRTALLASVLFALYSLADTNTFTAIDGTKYTNVRVIARFEDGVKITHSKGVCAVSFSNMAEADKTAFGYNETWGAKHAAAEAELAEIKFKEAQQKTNDPPAKTVSIKGVITQVLTNGVLVNREVNYFDSHKRDINEVGSGTSYEFLFLDGYEKLDSAIDYQKIEVLANSTGRYRFKDSKGVTRTINKYTVASQASPP